MSHVKGKLQKYMHMPGFSFILSLPRLWKARLAKHRWSQTFCVRNHPGFPTNGRYWSLPWDFLWNEVLRNVRNQMLDWLLQFSSELKQELARTSLASLSRGCHPVSNLWFWIGPGSKEPCLWHYGHALWLWHLSYIARLSSLEKAASLST
jgi:hypothetical protein